MNEKEKKGGELPVAVQKDMSVETMITHALDKGASIEVIEKMLAMRKEFLAERAKAAYIEALSNFQRDCPIIKKTKKVLNKDGRTVRYTFAPIDSIVDQIKKHVAANGLSYRWETKQEKASVTAICIVTHIMGHSESSDFTVDTDPEAYMTSPQKSASALTFAKRYTLCNALGISTGDEDTDAVDVKKEPVAKSDKSKIIFLLRSLGQDTKDKEAIQKAVKKLTQKELVEANYGVIVERLEMLVTGDQ